MGWLKKNKKQEPVIPETLSLKADQVISVADASNRYETVIDQISYDLQGRLKKEISGMLSEIVDTAIDNTRAETEQMLRNELIIMLEERIDKLVEQAIKAHLTKPINRAD